MTKPYPREAPRDAVPVQADVDPKAGRRDVSPPRPYRRTRCVTAEPTRTPGVENSPLPIPSTSSNPGATHHNPHNHLVDTALIACVQMSKLTLVAGSFLLWAPTAESRFSRYGNLSPGNSAESLSFSKNRGAFFVATAGPSTNAVRYAHSRRGDFSTVAVGASLGSPFTGSTGMNQISVAAAGDHVTGNMIFGSSIGALNSFSVAYWRGEYSAWYFLLFCVNHRNDFIVQVPAAEVAATSRIRRTEFLWPVHSIRSQRH